MIDNLKKIKKTFILALVLFSLFTLIVPQTYAKTSLYNAYVDVNLSWGEEITDEPIVPRDEIVKLKIKVTMRILTGQGFGAGLYTGYENASAGALVDFYVLDYPSWCSAIFEMGRINTNITEKTEETINMYIHVNEEAPAYTSGVIRIGVKVGKLGLIKGVYKEFNLTFKPAFFPIIKTDLPEMNTKRVSPSSEAVFPIEIKNAGNGETKVFLSLINIPKGWSASVTDSLILGENKGSVGTAYLTVIPPRNVGYHYDEADIVVEILPSFADDISIEGKPIYANFLIQNRGFSSTGFEFYFPIIIIAIIIIIVFNQFFIKKRKTKK